MLQIIIFKRSLFAGILNLALLHVQGQPGILDNSFGDSGKVINETIGYIYASALQKMAKFCLRDMVV